MPNFGNTLRNAFDKSLFSKKSYKDAVDKWVEPGAYGITIIPNINSDVESGYLTLIGVMSEAISINMDPEWDTLNLASMVSNFPVMEKIFNLASAPMAAIGVSINNAGLTTEKFFVKGSYLQIDPTFKVVNWNDDGAPLKAAFLLLSLCVPRKNYIGESASDIYGSLKSKIAEMPGGDTLIKSLEVLEGVYTKGSQITRGVRNWASDKLNGGKDLTQISSNMMLTNAPPTVYVNLGNYFTHPEMIIENVSIEFSKQMTKTGPLFVEFKTTLSSKTMPIMDGEDKYGVGLKLNSTNIEYEGDKPIHTEGGYDYGGYA